MFPKNMLLKHGWISWLKGFPDHRERADERTLVRPVKHLRLMNAKSFLNKLCDNVLNEISPIMNVMEDAPKIKINQNAIIDKSFENGLSNAKKTVEYVFLKDNWVNWKASCFCK